LLLPCKHKTGSVLVTKGGAAGRPVAHGAGRLIILGAGKA